MGSNLLLFSAPQKAGIRFPYDLNLANLPNGSLPFQWSAPTFMVSGTSLTNNPSVGAELLTDPGLEAAYTNGICTTLTPATNPSGTQSSDVHGDTKAQQFLASAFNSRVNYPVVAAVAGAWYRYSVWVKRLSGTGTGTRIRAFQASLLPHAGHSAESAINVSAYRFKQVTFLTPTTGNIFCYPAVETDSSNFDTVVSDDGSLKRLTYADLFALLPSTQSNVIAKCVPDTLFDQSVSALVVRASSQSSPTSAIFAMWRWRTPEDLLSLYLVELNAGTYTAKITEQNVSFVANAWLELRVNGDQVSMWYNNSQVGATQTIAPTGRNHGLLISGGNNVKRFFLQAN